MHWALTANGIGYEVGKGTRGNRGTRWESTDWDCPADELENLIFTELNESLSASEWANVPVTYCWRSWDLGMHSSKPYMPDLTKIEAQIEEGELEWNEANRRLAIIEPNNKCLPACLFSSFTKSREFRQSSDLFSSLFHSRNAAKPSLLFPFILLFFFFFPNKCSALHTINLSIHREETSSRIFESNTTWEESLRLLLAFRNSG